MTIVKSSIIVILVNLTGFYLSRFFVTNSADSLLDTVFVITLINIIIGIYLLIGNEHNAHTPSTVATATLLFTKGSPAAVDIAIDKLKQDGSDPKAFKLLNSYPVLIRILGFLGLGIVGIITLIILLIIR